MALGWGDVDRWSGCNEAEELCVKARAGHRWPSFPRGAQTAGWRRRSSAASLKTVSSIGGQKPMRRCFRESTDAPFLCTASIQQPPNRNPIGDGGARAAAAAGGGEGRGHGWCWDGPAGHQHAAQQRLQRKRRALQEIQVSSRSKDSMSRMLRCQRDCTASCAFQILWPPHGGCCGIIDWKWNKGK